MPETRESGSFTTGEITMTLSELVTEVIREYGSDAEKNSGHKIVDMFVKLVGYDRPVNQNVADKVMQAGKALRRLGVK